MFDSMMAGCHSNPTPPGRFHLILTADGRPVVHGWWDDRGTADRKLAGWVGEYGTLPDARITLVDEETGEELATWPGEA
ncbi:hypothetical protein ACFC08_00020 [Streptomyces sp. NPDC056112]|uniref:hypothetical protein n=1 Tax=Streptomyces sp. NPDC056112 TaxID=3345715 RepID=UPI0035E21DE1